MANAYFFLGMCCLLYGALTLYFDHIVPNAYGLALGPLFFLDPGYWGFGGGTGTGTGTAGVVDPAVAAAACVVADDASLDDDVRAEAAAVRDGNWANHGDGSAAPAVVIRGVQKTFTSREYAWLHSSSWAGAVAYGALPAAFFGGLSQSALAFVNFWVLFALGFKFVPLGFRLRVVPTSKITSFTAVKGVSYAIEDNSLFVLLGHNGAGKSTTFNLLTGLMPLTAGDATIFGYSVRTEMHIISQFMGVCPQHDVLWDNLTGREHLELFARLKGIPAEKIQAEVEARLADVSLVGAADLKSGSY